MTPKLNAKIIPDVPSQTDDFQGEGHLRSARALVQAVEQLADRDGAIGLEGAWGSGKSTVIKLAQGELSHAGKNRWHFFTFDLWLHQPELLKLAFLEELIAWAAARGLISTEEGERYAEQIQDREVTTRIESRRQLSLSGVFFVLLAPLLPIAYLWLSPQALPASGTVLFGLPVYGPYVATVLMIGLYAMFALAATGALARNKSNSPLAALSSAARVFSKETDHDKITQSIRERNPTSEAFQSFFRTLLSCMQKRGDRVVVVFDNIDRLPSDSIAGVWSDTRSIFGMTSRGAQPPNSQFVAIVPYDAKYIAEVFDEGEKLRRSEHLVKKTFDIALRVAPPLSTDWRKFLEAKLEGAFPQQLSQNDRYKLFKLLDLEYQDRGTLPTPRNIISYVNEVGALWNQWGDKIPVAHIALYVLARGSIELNAAALRGSTLVSPRKARVLAAEDWPRSLAALHFNVDPEHAYQVLLGQDIERLAVGDNPEEFARLATSNGFAEVFPDIVDGRLQGWATHGPELISKLARNMSLPEVQGDFLSETWHHVAQSLGYIQSGTSYPSHTYVGLAHLVRNLPPVEAQRAASRVMGLCSGGLPPEASARSIDDGEEWFKLFSALWESLDASAGKGAAKLFLDGAVMPTGASFSVGVCAGANDHPEIDGGSFQRSETDESVAAAALDLVQHDPARLIRVVKYTPWFASDQFWAQLLERSTARLSTERLGLDVLSPLARIVVDIRATDYRNGDSKGRVQQLANDGTFVIQAMAAKRDGDLQVAAAVTWLIIDALDGGMSPHNPGNHPQFGDTNEAFREFSSFVSAISDHEEALHEIANRVCMSSSFNEWLGFARTHTEVDFHKAVLKKIVADGLLDKLSTKETAKGFEQLEQILGSDLAKTFLQKFSGWASYFPKAFAGAEAIAIPPRLLRAIQQYSVDGFAELHRCVDQYFEGFSEEQWLDVLGGKSDQSLQLLLARIEAGYRPPVGPYSAALMHHTVAVLDGEAALQPSEAALFDGLQTNTRDKFVRDLLVNLQHITTTPKSVASFIKSAGNVVAQLPLRENANTTLDQLATPLISAEREAALQFVRASAESLAECFREARADVKGRLIEALSGLRQQDDDGEAAANEIARLMRIKIPDAGADG